MHSQAVCGEGDGIAMVALEGVEFGLKGVEAHNDLIAHPEQYLM